MTDQQPLQLMADVQMPNRTGLPDQLKAGVEQLSGLSMDDVQVHYHSAKPAQLQAFAYTQGTEIHVAPGQERHLPHEAWHVVQQKQDRVRTTRQVNGSALNDDPLLESEAARLGQRVALIRPEVTQSKIQNKPKPNTTAPIQRVVKARLQGGQKTTKHANLDSLCKEFGIKKEDLVAPLKDKLFAGNLFPAAYKASYATNHPLQQEMRRIVFGLDDLVSAAVSGVEIVAASGDANAVADQLFTILAPSITSGQLRKYSHYQTAQALPADDATVYISLLDMISTKLNAYQGQIDIQKYDEEARAKNSQMQNRVQQLKQQGQLLKGELDTATTTGQGQAMIEKISKISDKIRTLMAEIESFENAWDLDFWAQERNIDTLVGALARNPALGDHYDDEGGTDDGMNVQDEYRPLLACSLYAILAVKGQWLGTNDPVVLHGILRKTGQLKNYDDNKIAAKVRYLAGMTPTVVGNVGLGEYIQNKKQKGEKESFIVDAKGIAHTFAAVWNGNDYKKVDETGSNGNLSEYRNNEVLAVWK